MNILFRADSSSTIGTGHIMRDLVLAKQYPDNNIIFATQDLSGNIKHNISEAGYKLEILNSHDLEELDELIKKLSIDMIIIDHYDIDWKYEKQLSILNSQLSIKVLDDTYERHECDVLLNHNIYADKIKYKGLVPEKCELKCGINFTLLRDEFLNLELSKKSLSNGKFNVFIAMGGADSKNMNITILKSLKDSNINISLVTTNANKNLSELKDYVQNFKNIRLYIDAKNIASIISTCDIAIVTPSVMVNEIIFFKIPFISIMVTNNQKYMYEFLAKSGLPCLKKDDLLTLCKEVESLYDRQTYNNNVDVISNIVSKRMIL